MNFCDWSRRQGSSLEEKANNFAFDQTRSEELCDELVVRNRQGESAKKAPKAYEYRDENTAITSFEGGGVFPA